MTRRADMNGIFRVDEYVDPVRQSSRDIRPGVFLDQRDGVGKFFIVLNDFISKETVGFDFVVSFWNDCFDILLRGFVKRIEVIV